METHQNPNPGEISKARLEVIQKLAIRSKKNPEFKQPSDENTALLVRLDKLLTLLEDEVHITPQFKNDTQVNVGMLVIFDDSKGFKFPESYRERAKALYDKWESENWGAPAVTESEPSEDAHDSANDDAVKKPKRGKKRKRTESSSIETSAPDSSQFPSKAHPIWGEHGICHGIYRKVSVNGHVTPALDTRYIKRPANVFGNNGIKVGQWFPFQLSALFWGAHGKSQAGIYGTPEAGAWSVVASGGYIDLDEDHGEYLFYSGSGSHDNTDPNRPPASTRDTDSLHTSMRTQRDVRVIRGSKSDSEWAPTEGFRYDGVYRVQQVKHPFNKKGGMYEQFKLVRVEDQRPINKFRPNPQELRDFDNIKRPY